MTRVRVLLADDHAAVLTRVAELLEPEFDVVGTVTNGRDLITEAKKLAPDVVVLDISMPVLDGIEAAVQLRKDGSKAKVVFLTVQDRVEFVNACFAAGGLGYVVKSCMTKDLLPSIALALTDHRFISPSLQSHLEQLNKQEAP